MERKRIIFKGRRGARAAALQVLYQMDLLSELGALKNGKIDSVLELYQSSFMNKGLDIPFMETLVRKVWANRKEIDEKIDRAAEHWKIERMSPVDRNILRIAVCEMLFLEGIPPVVSINEAVELGKVFGDSESGAFINGVLDRIYKESSPKNEIPSSAGPSG